MLSIEQVRQLEIRVEKAVWKIKSLTEENTRLSEENKTLQDQLFSFQSRVNELERAVQEFKDDQGRIEEGILSALDKLSALEDSVLSENSAEQTDDVSFSAGTGETGEENQFNSADEEQNSGQMDIF